MRKSAQAISTPPHFAKLTNGWTHTVHCGSNGSRESTHYWKPPKMEAALMEASDVVPADKPEFVLKRMFNAPREIVYKIWTDPQYVRQWWGVEGSTIIRCELDVRPGGAFRIDMKAIDGTVYVNRGVYLEVIADARIVSKDVRDGSEMSGTLPVGTHIVTFEDVAGGTLVTLTSRFETREARDMMVRFGMMNGIRQSLDRFDRLVTSLETGTGNWDVSIS
jgi:uncharacterized protein YndB with AHSA1/START domain